MRAFRSKVIPFRSKYYEYLGEKNIKNKDEELKQLYIMQGCI